MTASVVARDVDQACPFNSPDYAGGLSHLGDPVHHESAGVTVLRRRIPGTSRHDGVSPWPYLWVDSDSQAAALAQDFRDLVTLTVVCQPGWVPPRPLRGDVTFLKQHYVFDPDASAPVLSRRAQRRLDRCRDIAVAEEVADPQAPARFHGLHRVADLQGTMGQRHCAGASTSHRQRPRYVREVVPRDAPDRPLPGVPGHRVTHEHPSGCRHGP